MDDKKLRLIHTACGIAVSAAIAIAAACLIVSVCTIYGSGDTPYTPESVGKQYARFAIPLWVAAGAVVAGILLDVFLPKAKKSKKSQNNVFVRLAIMQKKLSTVTCGEEINAKIQKERDQRRLMRAVCAVLCAAAFIPSVVVLCDFDAYTVENLTPAILRTVLWLAVGAAVSAVLMTVLSVLDERSAEREISQTKIALSEGVKAEVTVGNDSGHRTKIVRLALLGVACALIVIGTFHDGFFDVLQKAIRICTECIGLG